MYKIKTKTHNYTTFKFKDAIKILMAKEGVLTKTNHRKGAKRIIRKDNITKFIF